MGKDSGTHRNLTTSTPACPHVKTLKKQDPAQMQYLSDSTVCTHYKTPSEFSHPGPSNPSVEFTPSSTQNSTILFPISRLSSWPTA